MTITTRICALQVVVSRIVLRLDQFIVRFCSVHYLFTDELQTLFRIKVIDSRKSHNNHEYSDRYSCGADRHQVNGVELCSKFDGILILDEEYLHNMYMRDVPGVQFINQIHNSSLYQIWPGSGIKDEKLPWSERPQLSLFPLFESFRTNRSPKSEILSILNLNA